MHTSGGFYLHGGDNAFANRQKLLFDKLSNAELKYNKNKTDIESIHTDMEVDKTDKCGILKKSRKQKSETKRFHGKESIFKRPEGVAPRAINRNIPDYCRNPHKWLKYTLGDVSNDDMTEQSNTRAALSFLKELRERRSTKQVQKTEKMDIAETNSSEQSQTKVTFKSKKIKTSAEIEFKKPEDNTDKTENIPVIIDPNNKSVFRGSKIIMPEYVFGQKQKKKNRKEKAALKVDRLKQLRLDHLEDPDEDEN